ncbi:YaiI/YqxD family protein [[Clostridium] polysaccharolyticum]|uniref:UPF0178 protein SAMN04487772_102114 n=1 Tax=[Clostridium] polysaccharolyticum TaxID=29364 RepID=A0A1H9YNF0_9FIRM|nr:YaiI/YqxD family protein [[Clostridium] polysaccharolyticum]SES70527.1 hypothetical protein SAMN04487772_102114 [[Clostridium] polysaccharolyticum]
MKILVDADACPCNKIIERVAKEYDVQLLFLVDSNHILNPEYGEVLVIGQGADAVDFALINRLRAGDIGVTQDYGVAAMVLGKKGFAIHPSGKIYDDRNMDQMLFERHLSKVQRKANKRFHGKGPRKRTKEDDDRFERSFRRLVEHAQTIAKHF